MGVVTKGQRAEGLEAPAAVAAPTSGGMLMGLASGIGNNAMAQVLARDGLNADPSERRRPPPRPRPRENPHRPPNEGRSDDRPGRELRPAERNARDFANSAAWIASETRTTHLPRGDLQRAEVSMSLMLTKLRRALEYTSSPAQVSLARSAIVAAQQAHWVVSSEQASQARQAARQAEPARTSASIGTGPTIWSPSPGQLERLVDVVDRAGRAAAQLAAQSNNPRD